MAFRADGGVVTVSSTTEGKREALLGKPDVLAFPAGHRYRIKIAGSYKPASRAALVQPGDELVARLKYRAEGEASLQLALRSLEDPEAAESTESWRAASGEKGAREFKLAADPQQTGFYLGLVIKGAPCGGRRDSKLLRGGRVLVAGKPGEPGTRTDCVAGKGGKGMRCQPGDGDRVTLAQPEGVPDHQPARRHGARVPRCGALSLEGGRSLDAAVGEDARLVVTLVGSGVATLERIEVTDLGL